MKILRYGEWEIAVDIEKTREYYNNYILNHNQANRNFIKYCKVMTSDEKAFFESFGITPQCCEIEHIGVSKKKAFPCGGYYFVCGEYLKHPEEQLITVEEFAENGFEDDGSDTRIYIGLFQFDFQCEDHIISIIPENIPEGFICIRFWCEDMRWLLDEKPNEDMIMYEPPRFWEIRRIIKERLKWRRQRAIYLEEQKQEFISTFERLGVRYSKLSSKEIKIYKKNWVAAFSPPEADQKEIKKFCLSNRRFTPFLWHIFSWEFLASEEKSRECFNNVAKTECVIISNVDEIGFILHNSENITAEILDNFIDVTISDRFFSWTYSKTHEEMCGPYFYKKQS